jgi:hypothetical protein
VLFSAWEECLNGGTITNTIHSPSPTPPGGGFDDEYQPSSGIFTGWLIRIDPRVSCTESETNSFLAFGTIFCCISIVGLYTIGLDVINQMEFDARRPRRQLLGFSARLLLLAVWVFVTLVLFSAYGECLNGEMITMYHYPTQAPSLTPTPRPTIQLAHNDSAVNIGGLEPSLSCGPQCVAGTWVAGIGIFIFGVPSLWLLLSVWFRRSTYTFVRITRVGEEQRTKAYSNLVTHAEGQLVLFFIFFAFTPTCGALLKPLGSVLLELHTSNSGYWGLFVVVFIWLPLNILFICCCTPPSLANTEAAHEGAGLMGDSNEEEKEKGEEEEEKGAEEEGGSFGMLGVRMAPLSIRGGRGWLLFVGFPTAIIVGILAFNLDESRPILATYFFLGLVPLSCIVTMVQPAVPFCAAQKEQERRIATANHKKESGDNGILSELLAPFETRFWWFKSWLLLEQVNNFPS